MYIVHTDLSSPFETLKHFALPCICVSDSSPASQAALVARLVE